MSQRRLLLGCIADDFTGASDLANNLVRSGMRVVQTIGVPTVPLGPEVDAVVVALKSRTNPARQAVVQSLQALAWLQAQGAQQIYFKYCSTFVPRQKCQEQQDHHRRDQQGGKDGREDGAIDDTDPAIEQADLAD